MLFDLWIAGLMTTTMTMTWGLSYYLYNPEVQRKIREELDKVIGNDRLISTADKNDLPYLQAFVTETQRTANIIPLNLIHMTTRDTVIDGFPIQKGTGVIAQISTVMYDEKVIFLAFNLLFLCSQPKNWVLCEILILFDPHIVMFSKIFDFRPI